MACNWSRSGWLRFNRYVVNPFAATWLARVLGILSTWAAVSGKAVPYPWNRKTRGRLTRFPGGVAILTTYGPNRDWRRTSSVAGGADAPLWRPVSLTRGALPSRRGAPGVKSDGTVFARLLFPSDEATPYCSLFTCRQGRRTNVG